MNKTLLVIGAASVAAALFILACTMIPPLGALFNSGKSLFLEGLGVVQSVVTTNPLIAPISTLAGSVVTGLAVRSSALSKQNEMAASASQERTDILNQANSALSEQNSQITSLKTQVDALTAKVQETAQLKTQVATLQTKLTEAEQRAQQIQAEYNMAVRVKAIENSFPTENPAVH
jgi:predicted RNase H-like nuclease (RuvC/YqgF family)